jgi:HlyD family secretion protein
LAGGQRVEVRLDAIPGRTWEGTVTRVPTSVMTVGTRTVGEMTTRIDNSDRKLLPNVNVNVSIITAKHDNTLALSREAVHDIGGKRYVYVIFGQKLQQQEVQTGISNLTRVEIIKGISPNTQVALGAVNGAPLRSGMEVKVVER